jgi:hypothetical protein
MMTTILPGTTKRKRRTKEELARAAEEAVREKEEMDRIEARVESMVKDGGKLMEVHYKERGRHKHHRVLLYKNALFFPDHGMCTPQALLAEFDLLHRSGKTETYSILKNDACYGLAIYVLKPGTPEYGCIPHVGGFYRRRADKYGRTKEAKEWWSVEAFLFLREVYSKRLDRGRCKEPVQDPTVRGVPFTTSADKRLEPIIQAIHDRYREKLTRVTKRLESKGYEQLVWWRSF